MVENGSCRSTPSLFQDARKHANMGSIFVDNDNPSSTEKQRPHVRTCSYLISFSCNIN
jgi:hypothetical protein